MSSLSRSARIRRLAVELGLGAFGDPLRAILQHCEKQVRAVLREFPHCVTPAQLLEALANKLRTRFEIVKTDAELRQLQKNCMERGEKGFVRLQEELSPDVYGITIRLKQRELWEPDFVSVIDCRGEKAYKENYTKWHEIGHLLILTDESRATFRRTHAADVQDPEEGLVEVIAGRFAFWSEMIRAHVNGPPSFALIDKIRRNVCPEASYRSALIGIAKAWSEPLVLVRAELALRKSEERRLQQGEFVFKDPPVPMLRAVHVTSSDPAKESNLVIHQNMRVPKQSVIYRVFEAGGGYEEAEENLSWWETSDGMSLPAAKVKVSARFYWNGVDALITRRSE